MFDCNYLWRHMNTHCIHFIYRPQKRTENRFYRIDYLDQLFFFLLSICCHVFSMTRTDTKITCHPKADNIWGLSLSHGIGTNNDKKKISFISTEVEKSTNNNQSNSDLIEIMRKVMKKNWRSKSNAKRHE